MIFDSERVRVFEGPAPLFSGENALFLHGIRDPGNAGTIIRSADWYGVPQVVTSESVSLFNSKLVHASMGNVLRVQMVRNLPLQQLAATHHIYISDLGGTPVEQVELRTQWVLCVGSESHGVRGLDVAGATRITAPTLHQLHPPRARSNLHDETSMGRQATSYPKKNYASVIS